MATLNDVLTTLRTGVVNAVYPNGINNPSTAGVDTTIISGYPIRNRIDDVLALNNALISIFPTHKSKVVTKFERIFKDVGIDDATLTANVVENTITIGGVVNVPQAVLAIVDKIAYSYGVQIGDSLDSIAANLSLLIPNAIAVGPVITISNPFSVVTRIITNGTAAYELSRQERVFSICCWTTSLAVRDNLLNPIDEYFKLNYRIVLPDSFYAMVWPIEAPQPFNDMWQKSLMIIGNLEYKVQYPTTYSKPFTVIGETIQDIQIVPSI